VGPVSSASGRSRSVVHSLLTLAAVAFLLGALFYNTWSLELAARGVSALLHRPFLTPDAAQVHRAQILFGCIAAGLFLAAWSTSRFAALARFARLPWFEKISLALLVIVVPWMWLEVALHPFLPNHEKSTSLFVKDDRLGWKLRAGAVDQWGDVEVRVNERGFRGPVVSYPKPEGVTRIVYLGDSVTFGYRVARWEETFPFVADSLLQSDSLRVETVNLAVEGYSQWQELMVLADEGDRYQPDLVVVGFVLNDVTEMFHLARFGGSDEGFQLRHSYASPWDRLLSKSAVVYEIQNVVREVKARRTLGADLRLGAIRQQALEVETLMHAPEQANVKMAWDIALADLQRIVDHCAQRRVPVLVVVFPFTVQLSDPAGLSAPQQVLANYARARGIDVLDLLPELVARLATTGRKAEDLFLDHDHLSIEGHRVVADILAARVSAILQTHKEKEGAP
jgi:lysophospholipase L1-like esterase